MNFKSPSLTKMAAAINWCVGPLIVLLVLALWIFTRSEFAAPYTGDVHAAAMHGGSVVPLAGDRFHAEAVVEQGGVIRLFILGQDATRMLDVPLQSLTAYVAADGSATAIGLTAVPLPGDPSGRTSQFVGQFPPDLKQRTLRVTIPNLQIGRERLRIAFTWPVDSHDGVMPAKLSDEAERALYLTAAGKYKLADIAANGDPLPSQKFRGFRAQHDFRPGAGDRLCPISRTKANPIFVWVVDGQRYEFCCPPCIDEFVALAKEQPDTIERAEFYVAERDASTGFCTGLSATSRKQPDAN